MLLSLGLTASPHMNELFSKLTTCPEADRCRKYSRLKAALNLYVPSRNDKEQHILTTTSQGMKPNIGKDKGKAMELVCIPSTFKGIDSDIDTEVVYNETLNNALAVGNISVINALITIDSSVANTHFTTDVVPIGFEKDIVHEVGELVFPTNYNPPKDSELQTLLQLHIPGMEKTKSKLTTRFLDDVQIQTMNKVLDYDSEIESNMTFSDEEVKRKVQPLQSWKEVWSDISAVVDTMAQKLTSQGEILHGKLVHHLSGEEAQLPDHQISDGQPIHDDEGFITVIGKKQKHRYHHENSPRVTANAARKNKQNEISALGDHSINKKLSLASSTVSQ
ncbi:unnamed protein product [Cuscuta europaea]|uniref:Uncharacterized protein n=1 Tax=Cuscuta europaea TaxID=41803 RepID=A0A9P0ZWX4_CUSEU|nr:unnamed protein product [Cuscuta europaea]